MTTVVVFGGAGFLGRRLVHRLAPSFPERETSAIGTKQTNLIALLIKSASDPKRTFRTVTVDLVMDGDAGRTMGRR